MNFSKFPFVVVPILFTLVACGQGAGPGKTAVEMFDRVCKENNYSVFLDYIAPESAQLMQFGISIMEDEGEAIDEDYCNDGEIKVVSETITGTTAVVVLNVESKPMDWKKIDGKWKMYIKK
jgi:hypothetical protein